MKNALAILEPHDMTAAVHQLRPSKDPAKSSADELRAQDAALVASLVAGHPNAPAKLFDPPRAPRRDLP